MSDDASESREGILLYPEKSKQIIEISVQLAKTSMDHLCAMWSRLGNHKTNAKRMQQK